MPLPTPLAPFQIEALAIQQKLASGETISLDDLKDFILRAQKDLQSQSKPKDASEIKFF